MKKLIIIVIIITLCILGANYLSKNYLKEEKFENSVSNQILPEENKKQENNNIVQPEKLNDEDEIQQFNNEKATTITNLNLREQPNTNSNILLTMSNNTIIEVIAKTRNGWYKVNYNSNIGYVKGDYIKIMSEEEKKEITVIEDYSNTFAKVSTSSILNIREKANKNSSILTNVKAGSILKVLKRMQNDWYLVEGNAIMGYVDGQYIKILTDEEYSTYSSQENNMLKPEENIIATYTSKSTYNSNSRFNMHLAADYINGTIIEPGETYSHLKLVHPEGEPNKYVESTIFVNNGQTAQASGGGICQTSSTTYAAIVSATEKGINTGFVVSAQAPHSGRVNYVPRKYEATVSSGTQDFCFRNCNNYSIKIVTSYDKNTLTVTIYKL